MEESCNRCHRNKWLQWRHNGRDSVSNHQPHDCLLKGLFRRRSKKTWKLCATGLCSGNSPGTGEYPAQMASNAENVSIWWRYHVVQGYFRSDWWLHLDDGAHTLARWRKPAPHLNIRMAYYQFRNPQVKDMVSRPFYLQNVNPYILEWRSLSWDGPSELFHQRIFQHYSNSMDQNFNVIPFWLWYRYHCLLMPRLYKCRLMCKTL